MIDGNKLGDVGFQYLGTPYSVMDCQAFVEKCLSDCGDKTNLAGSNAWYREVMKNGWVGSPEECVKTFGIVPKGAFLFILQQDGKEPEKYKPDKIGNASHIGLCTGTRGEGAINSSASKGVVCESKFKGKSINGGWNRVGLWTKVAYDYGGGVEPTPTPTPTPTPEPQKITATVYADNGKPVNLRKRPGIIYALVDKVPCGEIVDVIDYESDWSLVVWKNKKGYMMSKFLYISDGKYYTVTIPHVDRETAESIVLVYGGEMKEEML